MGMEERWKVEGGVERFQKSRQRQWKAVESQCRVALDDAKKIGVIRYKSIVGGEFTSRKWAG